MRDLACCFYYFDAPATQSNPGQQYWFFSRRIKGLNSDRLRSIKEQEAIINDLTCQCHAAKRAWILWEACGWTYFFYADLTSTEGINRLTDCIGRLCMDPRVPFDCMDHSLVSERVLEYIRDCS